MMTDTKTRREQLNDLMNEMRASEEAAVEEMHDLFKGDDMKALLDKLSELQQRTVPGAHYDQILGSTIAVLQGTRDMPRPGDAPPAETLPQNGVPAQ